MQSAGAIVWSPTAPPPWHPLLPADPALVEDTLPLEATPPHPPPERTYHGPERPKSLKPQAGSPKTPNPLISQPSTPKLGDREMAAGVAGGAALELCRPWKGESS